MYEYRKLTPTQRRQMVAARRANGFPPHQPPHVYIDNQLYLLTAACFEHQPTIDSPARREMLSDKLFEQFTMQDLQVLAWVILPNHYHILAHVNQSNLLGDTMRRVHGSTASAWNKQDEQRGRKVWYRYSDRAIRSERHLNVTLNYIHFNPVKHGYVNSPYDWAHSSVHWYVKEKGRDWLRDLWSDYPIHDYGKSWDI